ncbi:hypothetical protein MRB53_034278 [Persea americana]|uniref:Uncharacterized protein n=1 Tax=Persea americana TaxID=3435 RepID=A0ACC2KXM5_PERAE|nr:hypothetical protein MRB53_034278 [Persea americana]
MSGGQPVTAAMHDAPVKELAWVPEMNLLVTGSWDKTLSDHIASDIKWYSQHLVKRAFFYKLVMVGMAAQKRKVNLERVLNRVWTLHMPQVINQPLQPAWLPVKISHPLLSVDGLFRGQWM